MPNPFEARNRTAKIVVLADALWARLTPEERRNPTFPETVAGYSENDWRVLADDAGQHMPSEETRRHEAGADH